MRRPLCLLSLAFAVILALCMQLIPLPVPDYEEWNGQVFTLEGQVYRKEFRREASGNTSKNTLVLYLKSVHILTDSNHSNHRTDLPENRIHNVICYMEQGPEPPIGSTARVKGKLQCFAAAANPGEFDASGYYRIMKVDFKLNHGTILAHGADYSAFKEGLHRLKKSFAANLDRSLTEKYAGIMKAMLLGDKGSLDKEVKELYKQSGIIHILAVSGLHISVIGMGLYRLLRRIGIPLKAGALLAVGFIWCYAVMTGMGASAVRAVIMFSLRLAADMIGRTYDMLTALAVAAALLLIEQPLYLRHSGFLFSFGAVLAIGLLLPALYEADTKGTKKGRLSPVIFNGIKQAAASGLAIALATLPIHLSFYYQFPVYSILLNLLVIPLMTIVMVTGLFCMAVGGTVPFFTVAAAYINMGILGLYEEWCLMVERLPYGNIITGQPHKWQSSLYILMLAVLSLFGRKLSGWWKGQWVLLALMLLLFRAEDGLKITVIDVGQGDSIHINHQGVHYLLDGGSTSKSDVGSYQIIPYLKSQGVRRLAAVFVTHADEDHCNGIRTLIEEADTGGVKPDCLILPAIGADSRSEAYLKLIEAAEGKGIDVKYMSRGEYAEDGELKLTCIHPYEGYETSKPNEYSLVLYMEYGAFTGLFTGDVEGRGEQELKKYINNRYVQEKFKKITLLKVSHHGSDNSTDDELLKLLMPELAVISCAEKNSYGHPGKRLLESLEKAESKVYITKDAGAVTIATDGKRMRIKTFRKP